MTFSKDECCKKLSSLLQCTKCQTVLLYTVDGYAYYARIEKVIDCKIALLVPGIGHSEVIIRHPDQTFAPQGTSIIREEYTYLDLCKVVAVSSPLFSIPPGFIVF